ncbi:MAG TPA: Ig-like domain-containing protein, partial [Chloroflexota bacterium]|nr:Ig-like domain-containing protein [Chloroflexota bacterium]
TFTVDAGASVQCALDASPYTACTSPQTQSYTGLTDGAHSFKVRAKDAAGNVNVVLDTFTVVTAPPAVSITGQPANPTNNANPSFTFSAEEGATLACSLTPSGGTDAFAPCSSPQSYRGRADGAYTFKVQATDAAGNSSSASYAFTIDTVAPAVPMGLTATATALPATPTNTAIPVLSRTGMAAPSTTSVPPTSTPTKTAVLRTVTNTPMPPTSTPTTDPATPMDTLANTSIAIPSSTPTAVPTTSHSTPAVASTRTAVPTATTAAQAVIADPTMPPTLPDLPNTGYGASATGADTRGNGALLSGALLGLLALAGGGVGAGGRRSGPR